MSYKTVDWAFDVQIPTGAKSVLLAIARYYNEEKGFCFPSRQTLKWCTGYGVSSVARQISWLVEQGILKVSHRRGSSSTYRIEFDAGKWLCVEENTHLKLRHPPSQNETTPHLDLRLPPSQNETLISKEQVSGIGKEKGDKSLSLVVNNGDTPMKDKELPPSKIAQQEKLTTAEVLKGYGVKKGNHKHLHQRVIHSWKTDVAREYPILSGKVTFTNKEIAVVKNACKTVMETAPDEDEAFTMMTETLLDWANFMAFLKVNTTLEKGSTAPDPLLLLKYADLVPAFYQEANHKEDDVKVIAPKHKLKDEGEVPQEETPITLEEIQSKWG